MRRQKAETKKPSRKSVLQKYAHKFDEFAPSEFKKMQALLQKNAAPQLSPDDFRFELGEAIYAFYWRNQNQSYGRDLAKLDDDLRLAIKSMEGVVEGLAKLDLTHLERIHSFRNSHALLKSNDFIEDLSEALNSARYQLAATRLSLVCATAFESRKSGRSRPRLLQIYPTASLCDLWERLSGSKVVTPKGAANSKHGLEATQPSTEFVRLGLKIIDTSITPANAMTLIKRALKEKEKDRSFLESIDAGFLDSNFLGLFLSNMESKKKI